MRPGYEYNIWMTTEYYNCEYIGCKEVNASKEILNNKIFAARCARWWGSVKFQLIRA
jgi:hypothetical protein